MTIKELRCSKCNKLLAKIHNKYHVETEMETKGIIDDINKQEYTEIKCARCKTSNKY